MRFYLICLPLLAGVAQAKKKGKYYLVETAKDYDDTSNENKAKEYGENYADGPSKYKGPTKYGGPKPYQKCSWSPWSEWPKKEGCEEQTLKRKRKCKCSDGSEGSEDECGGGQSKESKTEANTCVRCKWGDWSSWDDRKGCDEQVLKRRRKCECSDGSEGSVDKCGGGSTEETKQSSNEYKWDSWSDWGSRQGCEKQEVSRKRSCKCHDGSDGSAEKCGGGNTNEEKELPDICVRCEWGDWSDWGDRNGCDAQQIKRNRDCKCSDGSIGSPDKCGGGEKEESKDIPNTFSWGSWSSWCSRKGCEAQEVTRSRSCECAEDNSDGSSEKCGGGDKTESKQLPDKCVRCSWDNWGSWEERNGCHAQQVSRRRNCKCSDGTEGSADKCGGGEKKETKDLPNQYSWGPWSAWDSRNGCHKQKVHKTRQCKCEDGSNGSSSDCGGGETKESKELPNKCTTTPKPYEETPKPYEETPKPYKPGPRSYGDGPKKYT